MQLMDQTAETTHVDAPAEELLPTHVAAPEQGSTEESLGART